MGDTVSADPVTPTIAPAPAPSPDALASLVAWLNTIVESPEPDEVKSDDR